MIRIFFSLVVFISSIFLCNGQDFEVSPTKLFFNAEPGESQTKYLIVKNHSSNAETYILNISDYNVNNSGDGEYVEAGSMKNSVADWISIAPSFFEIEPNSEKEIVVTLQQPADEYGSKWGVIFVRTAKEQTSYSADKSLTAGMIVSPRIEIKVFQTPSTNRSFKSTINNISEITVKSDSIRTFTAIVNNLSDIITECTVTLVSTNVVSGEEFVFNNVEFAMYPKSSRKIELNLNGVLPKGTYSLAAILDYGSKTNLEGAQMIIVVE